jgi:hypothetical protein
MVYLALTIVALYISGLGLVWHLFRNMNNYEDIPWGSVQLYWELFGWPIHGFMCIYHHGRHALKGTTQEPMKDVPPEIQEIFNGIIERMVASGVIEVEEQKPNAKPRIH